MRLYPLALIALLIALAGCAFERHYSLKCGENRVIKVESGDRWYFDMEHDPANPWKYKVDDSDVEVRFIPSTEPGKIECLIRVHRGYDGPSLVHFTRKGEEFTVSLYKQTGDSAFWRP